MLIGKIVGVIVGFVIAQSSVFWSTVGGVIFRLFMQGVVYGFFLAIPAFFLWNFVFSAFPMSFLQIWAMLILSHIILSRQGS